MRSLFNVFNALTISESFSLFRYEELGHEVGESEKCNGGVKNRGLERQLSALSEGGDVQHAWQGEDVDETAEGARKSVNVSLLKITCGNFLAVFFSFNFT